MRNFKKLFSFIFVLLFLFTFVGCKKEKQNNDDIVILFTNDVHCGIEDNIGYAGLASYKKQIEEKAKYVTLVDCGDHLQGDYLGTITKGEAIVKIMNEVGYDLCVLGNHEFDYGLDQLAKNIEDSNCKYLSFNFKYIGNNDVLKNIAPYEIVSYGDTKIAYIGISTPYTIDSSSPTIFEEDGKRIGEFGKALGEEEFSHQLQEVIDECKTKGADYIIALAHLGVTDEDVEFTSTSIIQKTSGIDVLLDGHSHTEQSCDIVKNKDGNNVYVCQTGTKLKNIGQLVITSDGVISVSCISNYQDKDEEINSFIQDIKNEFEDEMNKIVTTLDFDLKISDSDNIRMVRNREVAIGDLVADAYRIISGADIGLCNGGGIRSDLNKGQITYADIISVNPFGNSLCVVEVTGQEIADMLEAFYFLTTKEYKADGKAIGENGSFQQVSGITFTINTNILSSAVFDSDEMLVNVIGDRRISDIKILEDGEYKPIDLNKTYTIASHDYLIKNGGCGMGILLKDHKLIIDEGIADYQVLIDYINSLNGDLSQYEQVQERIKIN